MSKFKEAPPTGPVRILYAGSGQFSIAPFGALHALIASDPDFMLAGILTQPPQPAGRGRTLRDTPLKTAARELGYKIFFEPEKLRERSAELLTEIQPDLVVVCDYGQIVPDDMLTLPRHQALNIHPSLLPRFRGAIPIPAAILAGDRKTGVSIQVMAREMDAGPLVAQETYALNGTETTAALAASLSELAARMLPATLRQWVGGKIRQRPQDDAGATYCYEKELTKAAARIDWTLPATDIHRRIRAYNPYPLAWTEFRGKRLIVQEASLSDQKAGPGQIVAVDRELHVGTGKGAIRLDVVQPEGKRAMRGAAFTAGYRPNADDAFI